MQTTDFPMDRDSFKIQLDEYTTYDVPKNFALANLRGINLSYLNLRDIDFSFAELHRADLSVADFRNCNLQGAILDDATFYYTRFCYCKGNGKEVIDFLHGKYSCVFCVPTQRLSIGLAISQFSAWEHEEWREGLVRNYGADGITADDIAQIKEKVKFLGVLR